MARQPVYLVACICPRGWTEISCTNTRKVDASPLPSLIVTAPLFLPIFFSMGVSKTGLFSHVRFVSLMRIPAKKLIKEDPVTSIASLGAVARRETLERLVLYLPNDVLRLQQEAACQGRSRQALHRLRAGRRAGG